MGEITSKTSLFILCARRRRRRGKCRIQAGRPGTAPGRRRGGRGPCHASSRTIRRTRGRQGAGAEDDKGTDIQDVGGKETATGCGGAGDVRAERWEGMRVGCWPVIRGHGGREKDWRRQLEGVRTEIRRYSRRLTNTRTMRRTTERENQR